MLIEQETIRLFALENSKYLGKKIAEQLKIPLGSHEERNFEDGEHKSRPLENVRNKDVFVIQSLYGEPDWSVNDKLCRLLFFIGALRDASAGRITAIVPYLCYARKDRKTKSRDPVTTRYVAGLFEAVGTDRVVTLDVHNLQAFQNAYRCRTDHLEAKNLFVNHFKSLAEEGGLIVMSPDVGGVKRAEKFRQSLSEALDRDIQVAFMEKQRSGGVVSGKNVIGNVKNKRVIIIDDMISSGTTLSRAAKACKEIGAEKVYAAATHGAFTEKANDVLSEDALHKVIITDTIPPFRIDDSIVKEKLVVLDTAELFAETIKRIHSGGSLVELLERE